MNKKYILNYEKLKSIRIANGYSQRQLSKELCYSQCYLSKIERGMALPSPEKLRAICEKLNIDAIDIIG